MRPYAHAPQRPCGTVASAVSADRQRTSDWLAEDSQPYKDRETVASAVLSRPSCTINHYDLTLKRPFIRLFHQADADWILTTDFRILIPDSCRLNVVFFAMFSLSRALSTKSCDEAYTTMCATKTATKCLTYAGRQSRPYLFSKIAIGIEARCCLPAEKKKRLTRAVDE